jgi:hypothetical protein
MSGAFTDLERLFTLVVPLLSEAIIQQLWEWFATLYADRLLMLRLLRDFYAK